MSTARGQKPGSASSATGKGNARGCTPDNDTGVEPMESSLVAGRLIIKSTGFYAVKTDAGDRILCTAGLKAAADEPRRQADKAGTNRKNGKMPGKARRRLQSDTDSRNLDRSTGNTVATELITGDRVLLQPLDGGRGVIRRVEPRRGVVSRMAAGKKAKEDPIAANVDQVLAIQSIASPEPNWNLADRHLVCAAAAGVAGILVVTKMDLAKAGAEARDGASAFAEIESYRKSGYTVIPVSSETGEGLDTLREMLAGSLTVLLGKSGVGKTSLLNALEPGLGQRVGDVSTVTGKGKHTTTHTELFELQSGGIIADTPGTREFGLWNVTREEIPAFFPEILPLVRDCRFSGRCAHRDEPGCAVRDAAEQGRINPRRWLSMISLMDSLPQG